MSKYSIEFKKEVVKFCINENHGYRITAKHFNIPAVSTVSKWCRKYKEHGFDGLIINNNKFNGKFKQYVVEYMQTNHLSATEVCIKFNLGNFGIANIWERIYYEKGPQGLYEKPRGNKDKNMSSKPIKKKLSKEIEEDLIAENQRLKMENEYLKKLNALVQERIKRENKKK